MKRIACIALLVLAVCFSSVTAFGYAIFWAQDDFYQTFNNGIGQAGMQAWGSGRIIDSSNNWIGTFTISGTNSQSAQLVGDEYITTYDSASLSIDMGLSGGSQWNGGGWFVTKVKQDGSTYPTGSFPTPVLTQPSSGYQSVGYALFNYTSGAQWANTDITVDWFGTYDWNNATINNVPGQVGNMQGQVSIPEPGTLILMGFGLCGVFYASRRKFGKKA